MRGETDDGKEIVDEEEDNWMQWQTGTLSGKNRSRLDGREETDGKGNSVGKMGKNY